MKEVAQPIITEAAKYGLAITWPTLLQAQTVASAVGHGTVGTTKPQ